MAEVHEIFNQPGARFTFLPPGEKYPPVEKKWERGQEHNHNYIESLKFKGNIGLMPIDRTTGAKQEDETLGFDLDNPASFEGLKLPESLCWETRPGRKAMIFRCKDKASRVKFGAKPDLAQFKLFDSHQIVTEVIRGKEQEVYRAVGEIKLERTYQVIPPSWKLIAVEGQKERVDYKLLSETPPAEISLEWLLDELKKSGIVISKKIDAGSKVAMRKLREACETIINKKEPGRNTLLNDSAFNLGHYVGAGQLSESLAYKELVKAGISSGLEVNAVQATVESGLGAGKKEPINDRLPEASYNDGLPLIITTDVHVQDITKRLLPALVNQNVPPKLFIRSNSLTLLRKNELGSWGLELLSESAVRGILARAANFMCELPNGDLKPDDPSLLVTRDVMSLPAWPGLPPIIGLIEGPVVRPDGSILGEFGYDPVTMLYYINRQELNLQVAENPTQEDAKKAAEFILSEVLCDFPFKGQADRANMVGAMLTVLARPIIDGNVMLGLFDKPQAGTGASMLTDIIARVTTGRPASMQAAPSEDEEWRKVITSVLMDSPSIVIIDNVSKMLKSRSLSQMLTARVWNDRMLGHNKNLSLPQNAVWFATGNNIQLGGDIARRSFWVRVDAGLARPWERNGWKHDPLPQWVAEHRGEILSALLTMIRTWIVAGKPKTPRVPLVGSFSEWCRVIGDVLGYAGIEGFLGNRVELWEQADSEVAQWDAFLGEWQKIHLEPITATTLKADLTASPIEGRGMYKSLQAEMPEEVIKATGRDVRGSQALGIVLKSRLDTTFPSGRQLNCIKDSHEKIQKWTIINKRTLETPQTENRSPVCGDPEKMKPLSVEVVRGPAGTLNHPSAIENFASTIVYRGVGGNRSPQSPQPIASDEHVKPKSPQSSILSMDDGKKAAISKESALNQTSKSKTRWTEEKNDQNCGSCGWSGKNDIAAVHCDPCIYRPNAKVCFLKSRIEPYQGPNIPRLELNAAGTTAILPVAEARKLIQAGMALLTTKEA